MSPLSKLSGFDSRDSFIFILIGEEGGPRRHPAHLLILDTVMCVEKGDVTGLELHRRLAVGLDPEPEFLRPQPFLRGAGRDPSHK